MNNPRGEVQVEIDGTLHRICLTLGGLAELETEFACESLAELQVRMRNMSASEMKRVLEVLLLERDAPVNVSGISPGAAARAIGEAFHVALG